MKKKIIKMNTKIGKEYDFWSYRDHLVEGHKIDKIEIILRATGFSSKFCVELQATTTNFFMQVGPKILQIVCAKYSIIRLFSKLDKIHTETRG